MSSILITSAGKRVSLVKAFQTELQKLIPEAKVITTDASPELSAACTVADDYFKVPRLDHPTYINELISNCTSNNINLVIPTIDTELLILAENRDKLLSHGINSVISSENFIHKCRDKRLVHSFFSQNNIETPQEFSKDNYKLPVFIKPVDGSRSLNTFLINSEDDFVENHFKNEQLMFLEYIDQSEYVEFTCDLYFGKDHGLKCVVPRKRIEVRDGEVNKGKTEKNILVDFIKKKLPYIEGAQGCLTAQFFKHITTDRILGIEINPRFGGGYPLSYYAGANYPKWIIQEYLLNQSIIPNDDWENNLLMLRYDKEVIVKNSDA